MFCKAVLLSVTFVAVLLAAVGPAAAGSQWL